VIHVESLTTGLVEDAARVIAAEQRAARSTTPGLTVDFTETGHCRTALNELLADDHSGFVAHDDHRILGVLCAKGRGDRGGMRAEGLAVLPGLQDPTAVLVALYAQMAPQLLAGGAIHHWVTHVNLEPLGVGLGNLGFGRIGVYGSQPARPASPATQLTVRVGNKDDLGTIVALSSVEMGFRFTPPIYALPQPGSREHVERHHRQLLAAGAVHLLASTGGADVGLATIEFTSPAPRICPNGQPYIGPTATHPAHRGQGVGRALVNAVLDWSYRHEFQTVSVDFDSANPLSRPFWLGAGFAPVGYQVARSIHPGYLPGTSPSDAAPAHLETD